MEKILSISEYDELLITSDNVANYIKTYLSIIKLIMRSS